MATALTLLLAPLLTWFKLVSDTVSDPYLDEFFHVRQVQHYCQNRFDVWDPKITTPPGLYLLSYTLSLFTGCNITALRSLNVLCTAVLPLFVMWTYRVRASGSPDRLIIEHCTLNAILFPPLFFFAALYYTDVASTLSVVIFYWYFLQFRRSKTPQWQSTPILIQLGLISLLFRQTNIFWVAVFPAAIVLVSELDRGHQVVKGSMNRRAEGFGDSLMSVARTSWKMDVVYAPSVRDAWMEDYIRTVVSIAACSLKVALKPKRILSLTLALTPYLALIGLFASFILWNGGVVLGDKSNHVATLHLPQMLYIWPYITFFSWPLLYSYLLTIPLALFAKLRSIAPLEIMLIFKRRRLVPRMWLIVVYIALAGFVVHFNTIVHPFTLADNRHYTFYVFRLLMRPWWMKYAVTPGYVFSAWACIQALGARPSSRSPDRAMPAQGTSSKSGTGSGDSPKSFALPDGDASARTTFVLAWLATSSLQLVTAPLVEPRYFILPWMFWRIHLPLQRTNVADGDVSLSGTSWETHLRNLDPRLLLETIWLLTINLVTGYIFLRWEFSWPQEPAKVQRFMW